MTTTPDNPDRITEAAVLDSLAERLEAALDLVASSGALTALLQIEKLCLDAAALARAGHLILCGRSDGPN